MEIGTVTQDGIQPLFIQYGGMEPEFSARICLSENAADDKIIFITRRSSILIVTRYFLTYELCTG
ncbi:MAG: hypothetical protein ACTINL_15615, partial [Serratia proteamaculans]